MKLTLEFYLSIGMFIMSLITEDSIYWLATIIFLAAHGIIIELRILNDKRTME